MNARRKMNPLQQLFSLLCLLLFATTAHAEEIVRDQNSPEEAKTKSIDLKTGDSLRIEDGFELTTTTDPAVSADGENQIDNAGEITTTGDNFGGIHAYGDKSRITNSGTLTTKGDNAHGIYVQSGSEITILNSGTLTTKGSSSVAIYSSRHQDSVTIINSHTGILKTENDRGAYAIRSDGNNARITNHGTLTTEKDSATGIHSTGTTAIIINTGTLTTKGATGIHSGGDKAIITNSGTLTIEEGLTTEGDKVHGRGIYSDGDNAVITNSGTIQSEGGEGVYFYGSHNATLTNSGTISIADLTNGHAISASPDSTGLTLNIEPGSRIIGRIDLGGAETGTERDTLNINDPTPTRLVVENVEIVNLNVDGFMQVEGTTTTITVVRPPTATAGRALSALSNALQGVSQQRLDNNRALGLTLSNARHFQARAPLAWGQVFGSSDSVDARGQALAYDLTQQGFSIGYERDYWGRRLGLFGGVATSNSESAVQSFAQETTSTYFGAYAHFNLGDFNLATALIAGTDRHDNERLFVISNLRGGTTTTAKAGFNGWFLSPSVSLSWVYDLNDRIELRPSIRLDYSLANRDKYTESGTIDADLAVNSRNLSAFTAQLQVAAVYHLNPGMDLTAHLGFGSRHFSEDDMKVSLGSESIEYVPAGESSSSGLIAGLGLRTTLSERLQLAAGIKHNGGHLGYQLNLEYGF